MRSHAGTRLNQLTDTLVRLGTRHRSDPDFIERRPTGLQRRLQRLQPIPTMCRATLHHPVHATLAPFQGRIAHIHEQLHCNLKLTSPPCIKWVSPSTSNRKAPSSDTPRATPERCPVPA